MSLPLLAVVVAIDSLRLCVTDATTGAPLIGARTRVDSAAVSSPMTTACATIGRPAPSHVASASQAVNHGLVVQRVGYRTQRVAWPATTTRDGSTLTVALTPSGVSDANTMALAPVTVRGNAPSITPALARMTAERRATDARRLGATTTHDLVAQLPFTMLRSARGETNLSLRGARREQVVVTLDGLPLNDPATGVADLSDLPLAALGAATVTLGADPLGAGSGASGGVLALTAGAPRVASLGVGAFGQRQAELALRQSLGTLLVSSALMHRTATNDFPVAAGLDPTAPSTRRINNDETITAATLGLIAGRWQMTGLLSHTTRGMVGPLTVHAYDADRSVVNRALLRAQAVLDGITVQGGLRTMGLTYRDPARPEWNSDATSHAADLELRSSAPWRVGTPAGGALDLNWRAGLGADALRASGAIAQDRARAFVATNAAWHRRQMRVEGGVRLDAITQSGVRPSLSFALEQQWALGFSSAARVTQAFRAPTLYDLYGASPQRLTVKPLSAERVRADVDLSTQWRHQSAVGLWHLAAALVARETQDAIVWFPGNFGWSPANVGAERLRGVEARASHAHRWSTVSAWVTRYDAMLRTDALRIPTPYVPRLAAGGEWIAQHRTTVVRLGARYLGDRPYTAGPRDAAYVLPPVTLLSVALSHALPIGSARRYLGAFDAPRITWALDNVTNAAWQSVRGFPAPGRSWSVSITLQDPSSP